MKTITVGFFKSVLTDEEFDLVWEILCEWVDPDGFFNIDHLGRDVVVTEYLINSIEEGFRVDYDKDLLKSIVKKLKDNPCDYYSAFEKGNLTDYFYENLADEYDDEDEYIEMHKIEEPLTFVLLDEEDSKVVQELMEGEYSEEELDDMYSALESEERVISPSKLRELLKKSDDTDSTKEKIDNVECDYFLVEWE